MSEKTRFKFRCIDTKSQTIEGEGGEQPARYVRLLAVSADGTFPSTAGDSKDFIPCPENAVFGRYTPSGEFEATVLSPHLDAVEVGKEYYLTLEPAN